MRFPFSNQLPKPTPFTSLVPGNEQAIARNATLATHNDEDFKAVIAGQCSQWLDPDPEKYLRPETLFGPKFWKEAQRGRLQ